MALSGTLDDFSIVDIIQLVDLGKKSGVIELRSLQGSEAMDGRIFFFEGAVHGAETGTLSGEAALYNLFLATNGNFELHEGSQVPPRTIHSTNAFVILEGSSRREAWVQMCRRVPHTQQLLALVPMPVAAPEEITITRDKWRILTMIDGCTSVGEIVLRAGIGRQRALQMIVELVDEGLAELREPEPSR